MGLINSIARRAQERTQRRNERSENASSGASAQAPSTRSSSLTSSGSTGLAARPRRLSSEAPILRTDPRPIFSDAEQAQFRDAKRVVMFEYSSTGGGHTARGLDPLLASVKKGDVVVIMAPPGWPHDKGNAQNTLRSYMQKMQDKGIPFIVKQADKTITGLYKPTGESDNAAMIADFVDKARRPVGLGAQAVSVLASTYPKAGEPSSAMVLRKVDAFQAKNIVSQILHASGGDPQKLFLIGDMAPYAQKAAKALGVPEENRVEIGNHQSMFDSSPAMLQMRGSKDMAYVFKAAGNNHVTKLALVDYNAEMNTVTALPEALRHPDIGITPSTTKAAARKIALKYILEHAAKNNLAPGAEVTPGIIAREGITADTAKSAVYLYVNDYTKGIAEHIKAKINEGHPDYQDTVFVLTAKTAWKTPTSSAGSAGASGSASQAPKALSHPNILHLMYAANADGVTSAGFGTTSEFNYLKHQGYAGKFVAVPVEHQHEQQANAVMLEGQHAPGVISTAHGIEGLKEQMDLLVANPTKTADLEGDMSSIVRGSEAQLSSDNLSATHAGHAAALIEGRELQKHSSSNLLANIELEGENNQPKQVRRLTKLHVSALEAIIKGESSFTVAPTSKVDPHMVNSMQVAIDILRNKDMAAEVLNVELEGPKQDAFRTEYADALQAIIDLPAHEQKDAATKEMNRLGDRFFLGW
jgi:hypothetical protein